MSDEDFAAEARAAMGGFLGEVAMALMAGIWCLVITVVVSSNSWVIYGLQLRVKEATELGQYELEQKIGSGGMGTVYKARHALLRRPTAVKLLDPDKTTEAIAETPVE